MSEDKDPKVKELLERGSEAVVDDETAESLARWFGLPSFQQVAEQKPEDKPEDPELVAKRERRDAALAAVDPKLLAAIARRTEIDPEELFDFHPNLELHVDPAMPMMDLDAAQRGLSIDDQIRDVEISEDLRDDLKDVTPQALLRDLHRSEQTFDKTFEIVDVAAEQRLDIVAEVATAMATSWKLPPLGESPVIEGTREIAAAREDRRKPWAEAAARLPNRRVQG